MRIAWFSPLPPARSGIAAYSAELLPLLRRRHAIDDYVDAPAPLVPDGRRSAHDFVWIHRQRPYDLVVHQLGNAPCHDYQWAYLAHFPGLVVLHDARLHHSRARGLLRQQRRADYRREFLYDHPTIRTDAAEYAVEGLGGNIQYLWPMLGAVVDGARAVAVHNSRVADDLRQRFPRTLVSTVRMGVPSFTSSTTARGRIRRDLGLPGEAVLFAAYGKVTAEKRIGAILRALSSLTADGINAHVVLVGDAAEYTTLSQQLSELRIGERVHAAGYVADEAVGDFLAAADVCLCLRWPTALETSASWLRCLAAARPTVISDLAHLVDIPTVDPRTWQPLTPSRSPVAVAIDLLDEDRALTFAMRRLATDETLRKALGSAGHEYWRENHSLEAMAEDYEKILQDAAARPAPALAGLPEHFTRDHGDHARAIAHQFGVTVDILQA